ncbi:MAG: cysteine desulfurase [Bacteroidaceae bacterium]|nr:cysteine desulfurase [Bacteroidaceae bacterium]
MLDIRKIREEFPILHTQVYGKPLTYLDNAATTQKPRCVVEAERQQYYTLNANVHRGVHYLSEQATDLLEQARDSVRRFIGAASVQEIVFTRGTTEGINLVASSLGQGWREGDEILVSAMEHHSNIVPWQLLAQRRKLVVKVIPMDDQGNLLLDAYASLFTERTRMVCVTQVSNVLGTVNPVREMARIAHAHQALVLVDGAQSTPHMPVNVADMDCDFFVFSGHKVYAPTGIGVLYGKEALLEKMPPYQGGGEMIASVTWDKTVFEELPYKFEAGTPNYVGSHALKVALDYVQALGLEDVNAYERSLGSYARERMAGIDGLRIYGEASEREAIVSFLVKGIHHLDMGTLLDRLGIAVRTGHHCAQPVMDRMGIDGTVRASFSFYNTREEVDALVDGIERVRKMF